MSTARAASSRPTLLTLMFIAALVLSAGAAEDWTQYNGPGGDRISAEQVGLRKWSAAGPPELWKIPTPTGFSSFSVADGMAFTLVRRTSDGEEREVCLAVDAATGEELWSAPFGAAKYDRGGDSGASDNRGGDGPRCTPSYEDGRVYVLDPRLNLFCIDAESGDSLWTRDIVAEHGGRLISWQSAASPLVEGDLVFVAGGGAGQSLLAFDKANGDTLWQAHDERMTHATPIAATLHGVRQVIFFVQAGLVAVEPETGEILWRTEFPYRTSTAASPVVHGEVVYCSAGYGVGAAAFRIDDTGEGFQAELLWRKANKLQNHWSTPLCLDGHLFGMFSFKKYGEGPLKCVDILTGEEKWSVDGYGPGNVILVGDLLVALSDAGEVVLVEPTPEEYREVARADILKGKCWSTPVFSDGQLYARSTEEGICLDLSGSPGSR